MCDAGVKRKAVHDGVKTCNLPAVAIESLAQLNGLINQNRPPVEIEEDLQTT
jgi:hypothetical protein